MCGCSRIVLYDASDDVLHVLRAEVLDEVEMERCVAAVRDDADMCHVPTDGQPCHQSADALQQLRKLAAPVLRLVHHDHQVERHAAQLC